MKQYTFNAAYGNETKQVVICSVSGGYGSYHLYIDKYSYGSFHKALGKWKLSAHVPNLTPEDENKMEALRPRLQTADIDILEEIFKSNSL